MIRIWLGLAVALLLAIVPANALAQDDDKDKEKKADEDYLAKFPGFKGTPFEGRKNKSERAVYMELFTGAQCPPCVAADLAFDVLMKSYKTSELVLVQYHMHFPGPDPMANPNTMARWNYYKKAYPKQMTGVPSSLFNGKPKAGGGAGAAGAEKKYMAYQEAINPLLEEPDAVKIAVRTQRKGDQIDIDVDVNGLKEAGNDKKLRILLAEHTVRYVGGNKIRFHHNVVRAFPGGVEGKELTETASKHQASINLSDLRGDLTKYLDKYQDDLEGKTGKKFTFSARPMDFNDLLVIAFVQDDTTQEILHAVQVEVAKK